MTLPEAKQFIECHFASVASLDRRDPDPSLPLVCSGGEIDVKGVMPALYATEELAIRAWREEADKKSNMFSDLEWVFGPELLDFQMTMADRNQSHRLVTKRYAVRSQMRIK